MKKILFALIVFSLSKGYSQVEKETTQLGIGALPISDVFRIYPDNKLSGIGISANFGYFPIKRLSIGLNPYYAQAANSYSYFSSNSVLHKESENLKLYGLNACLRYYIISKNKFLAYPSLALGFGAGERSTIDLDTRILKHKENAATFLFSMGIGINYLITEKIALELNVPYVNVKFLTTDVIDPNFQTIIPTFGFQFYLK